jgi:hypothetical protein
MTKTIKELEREAYINGDIEKAKLLGEMEDKDKIIYDLEDQLEWEQRNHD